MEEQCNRHDEDISHIYKKLTELNERTRVLQEENKERKKETDNLDEVKADKSDLDDMFQELQNQIASMAKGEPIEIKQAPAAPAGPQISKADIKKWNEAADTSRQLKINFIDIKVELDKLGEIIELKKRITAAEKRIDMLAHNADLEKLRKEVEGLKKFRGEALDRFDDIQKQINELNRMIAQLGDGKPVTITTDNDGLRDRMNKAESKLHVHQRLIESIEGMIKNININNQGGGGSGVDPSVIDGLNDLIDNLRREFEENKKKVEGEIQRINHILPTKADKSDLEDLENRLLEQMKDMIRQLLA